MPAVASTTVRAACAVPDLAVVQGAGSQRPAKQGDPQWRPNEFRYTFANFGTRLRFPFAQLLDYEHSSLRQGRLQQSSVRLLDKWLTRSTPCQNNRSKRSHISY